MVPNKLIDVRTAAVRLCVSKTKIYQMIHSDPTFPVIHIGKKYVFDPAELDRWIEHRKEMTVKGV